MLIEIGLEFHRFEGSDEKTSVYKYKTRIPVFGKRSSGLQWLKKLGQNTSIWKDKIRNPMFIQIGLEFQCLEG